MGKNHFTDPQLCALCRGLSLMLHAGISLADSAFLLAEEEQGDYRSLLEDLGQRLDQGMLLSDAMEGSGAFPGYVTGMVRIGEASGQLEEALSSLADHFEERHRMSRQLYSAIAYPSMILLLMLAVVGVLLIKVLPVFDKVYASLGSRLTGIAGGLLELGQWLSGALPALLAVLVFAVIAALVLVLCHPLRERIAGFFRKRFGDRGVSRKYNNARFARAMAMGLSSGLTFEETLDFAKLLLSDVPGAADRCALCAARLAEGASLAEAMGAAGLLDAASCRLLTVGLRGGNSDRVMGKIADNLAEEASLSLERTISRIEPAMVLSASLLVGAILLTVMLPLMNLLSSLG